MKTFWATSKQEASATLHCLSERGCVSQAGDSVDFWPLPMLSSSHSPSPPQSLSESTPSVQVHKLFTRQREQSQSTGSTEIPWVTRTKPPITKLAWHRFKAFNFAQQTLNSPFLALPASLPQLPTLVLCTHYPVFILTKVFGLSPKVYFCFLE